MTTLERFPLSFSQQRLWLLDRFEPGATVWNVPTIARLRAPVDEGALGRALDAVVARHESLRTTFDSVDGEPFQVVSDEVLVPLEVVEIGGEDREAEALRIALDVVHRPFDLVTGPLVRFALLRLAEDDHFVVLSMHHIVSDGWSVSVFLREIGYFYEGYLTGSPRTLPELPIQYVDYAVWQRDWMTEEPQRAQLAYWTRQLEGLPPLELPTDRPRPARQSHAGASVDVTIAEPLRGALGDLCRREGTTPYMTLLAGLAAILGRWSGQDDVAIGSPVANRNQIEVENLIGVFVNTLVMRVDLSGSPTFRELLGRVRRIALDAYSNQDVPFEYVLDELRVERDPSRTPLFQVWLNYVNTPEASVTLAGVRADEVSVELLSKFDLTFYVTEEAAGLRILCVYDPDLFDRARVEELLDQLRGLLERATARPDDQVASLSLVTPAARSALPDPAAALSASWEGSVPELFALQARLAPAAVAAADPRGSWTYADLDARANRLANALRACGVAKGDVVAIYAHRSAPVVWAILGVLKAGAAFTMLDPAYPSRRLVEYLERAKPRAFVRVDAAGAPPGDVDDFLDASGVRCRPALPALSLPAPDVDAFPSDDPRVEIGPDDLAYVAFTSGSTGGPKGVLGRHGPLTHFQPWLRDAFGLGASDRFSMLSGLAHDPLHRDVFTPLLLGASVHAPDPDDLVPGKLARWMAWEGITVANMTPPMGRVVSAEGSERVDALRRVFFVGDALTRTDVARLRAVAPRVRCVNFYGSTETQRAVGYYEVPDEPEGKETLPAGAGIPDVQLLVMNAAGGLAGVSELGEVCVRSPHLARGYLDEAATRERFAPNPFGTSAADRIYRTGDLGRYLPSGAVELAGRADAQVKVRGFRVEAEEVEAALKAHPAVREVCVTAVESPEGEKRLVAYVVADALPSTAELRRWLAGRLPDYMVPAAFVPLAAIPLTPNNKPDRRALPAPDWSAVAARPVAAAPRAGAESALARIWADVLGVGAVGRDDNFFDLGGDSLRAMQVVARVRATLGVEVPLRALFDAQTLAELAAWVEGE